MSADDWPSRTDYVLLFAGIVANTLLWMTHGRAVDIWGWMTLATWVTFALALIARYLESKHGMNADDALDRRSDLDERSS